LHAVRTGRFTPLPPRTVREQSSGSAGKETVVAAD